MALAGPCKAGGIAGQLLAWGGNIVKDEYAGLDAVDQARLIRRGEVSPLDLVEAAIARVEALNPALNAVITPLFDKAREQAESPALTDGPFRGVPMVLKDFICHSAGDSFFEGMGYLKKLEWTEVGDTHLAAKFREEGFINIAKTNTCELALTPDTQPTEFGPTRNPWNVDRSTFGSSGGSAAAVASRMVPVGHANDAGGSIRMPAGACGLVGLKPTHGRVSLGPEFGDLFGGLVSEHVLARSVRDSAAVLDAISSPMPGDPSPISWESGRFADAAGRRSERALKIGFMDAHAGATVHADCSAAVHSTAKMLEDLGHQVEPSHPAVIEDEAFMRHFGNQVCAGTAWLVDHYWPGATGIPVTEADVEGMTWAMAEVGRAMNAADFLAGREAIQLFGRDVAMWFHHGDYDLLLSPTTPMPPPEIGSFASIDTVSFAFPFNCTGQPAMSVPVHQTSDGFPVGVQLVAKHAQEELLFEVAAQLEQQSGWLTRKPPICA